MTQTIKLSNGDTLNFPDEMSDDKIHYAIQKEYGNQKSSNGISDLLSKSSDAIINTVQGARLPSIAGGMLQGAADMGISAANLPLELMGTSKIPHPDLGKYLPTDTASRLAYTGGQLLGGGILASGIYNLLGKGAPALSGISRILGDVLKGGATGYLTGEEAPMGRTGGAVLGSIASAANLMRPKVIAEKISNDRDKIKDIFKNKYNDLFKTASENEMGQVNIPDIVSTHFDYIDKNLPENYVKKLREFIKNPSTENAHWAQSDLGKYVNKFSQPKYESNLSSSQIDAIKKASSMEDAITNAMHETLSKNKNLNLSDAYKDITMGYAKDYISYTIGGHIAKYLSKDISESQLMNRLSSSHKFMDKLGNKYPELKIQGLINNPFFKAIAVGGAGGLGFKPVADYFYSK